MRTSSLRILEMTTDTRNSSRGSRKVRLGGVQLAALKRCASGISLRFDDAGIVNALLDAGYIHRNVVGVISVTQAGLDYLQAYDEVPSMHAPATEARPPGP
jgi:hypothetical protein